MIELVRKDEQQGGAAAGGSRPKQQHQQFNDRGGLNQHQHHHQQRPVAAEAAAAIPDAADAAVIDLTGDAAAAAPTSPRRAAAAGGAAAAAAAAAAAGAGERDGGLPYDRKGKRKLSPYKDGHANGHDDGNDVVVIDSSGDEGAGAGPVAAQRRRSSRRPPRKRRAGGGGVCEGAGGEEDEVASRPPGEEGQKQKQLKQEEEKEKAAAAATAEEEYEQNRFRCALCKRDACAACRATPYHKGLTCAEHAAPKCLFCDAKVVAAGAAGSAAAKQPLHRVKAALGAACGLEADWCTGLGREALAGLLGHVGQVCKGGDCQQRVRDMCLRPLPCGHYCCGLRGETRHLPCVQPECDGLPRRGAAEAPAAAAAAAEGPAAAAAAGAGAGPSTSAAAAAAAAAGGGGGAAAPQHVFAPASAAAASSDSCFFCWEELRTAPCIALSCPGAHVCHLSCARERLKAGCPGPEITFNYLYCPLCGSDHVPPAAAGGSVPGSDPGAAAEAARPDAAADEGSADGAGGRGGRRRGRRPAQGRRGRGGAAAAAAAAAEKDAAAGAVNPELAAALAAPQACTAAVHLEHPALKADLKKHLDLRDCVVTLARGRLQEGGAPRDDPLLQPGGRFEGRLLDHALARSNFYQCAHCAEPYFGGARQCGGAQAAEEGREQAARVFDKNELVCGTCVGKMHGVQDCPRHGSRFIEFKCHYCCDIASWFCWGKTHFCDPCHRLAGRNQVKACDPTKCRLGRHPPNPCELALGCGLCRLRGKDYKP